MHLKSKPHFTEATGQISRAAASYFPFDGLDYIDNHFPTINMGWF